MTGITPTAEQDHALTKIVQWHGVLNSQEVGRAEGEFLLDGGAGTGKTTVAALATRALNLRRVVYASLTAKAARVMREKGMDGASTLHSLLYRYVKHSDGSFTWERNTSSAARSADLIVVDEVSMVSETIAADLRHWRKPTLVLGDVGGQLPPPHGAGAFINHAPDFHLTEPHRQAVENPITRLAWLARRGARLHPGGSPEARVATLTPAAWDHILSGDAQVILVGKHTNRCAIIRRFREKLGYSGPLPLPGEPIICCRNDHHQDLINGETAVVWRIVEDAPNEAWFRAELIMEDSSRREVRIQRKPFTVSLPNNNNNADAAASLADETFRASHWDFAYAITVHKAQGSEWDDVVLVDDQFGRWDRDLHRRWLYTGITRARKNLTVYLTS